MRFQLKIALYFLIFLMPLMASAADKGVTLKNRPAENTSEQGRRVALVIGNSAYRHSGSLANPARDAELMAKALKEVGFQLHGGRAQTDLTRTNLDLVIESFGDDIKPGDVALFYYSGHGLQVAGENYLVPIDADIKKESEVRVKTVSLNLLFAKLEGIKDAVNIVVLDACRNNPFARSFRSSSGGLASISAPTGTIVAFSTAPGQVAEDGNGQNSTYTAALAQYVKEPGLQVEEVFKKVRSTVSGSTKGTQTPWENTSLTGSFTFVNSNLSLKNTELSNLSQERRVEIERLRELEAGSAKQKKQEELEIRKREGEIAKMDAEIDAMKQRLGSAAATGNDNLQKMLAMVRQRESDAQRLENLKRQREEEERKRQQEIERLRAEQENKRRTEIEEDIKVYEEIVGSPFGRDMVDTAWASLTSKYALSALSPGDVAGFRKSMGIAIPKQSVPLTISSQPLTVVLTARNGNVTFSHKAHSSNMACNVCHGDGTPGKLVMDKDKAHSRCKDCHAKNGAGPTRCGECHRK